MLTLETSHLVNFKLLLISAFSLTATFSAVEANSLPMPEEHLPELKKLLLAAERQAPQLIEQSITEQEAEERLKRAKAAYYPRLDLNSNLGLRQTSYDAPGVEDESSGGVTFHASITRPFYHWGAIEAQIQQARLDNESEALHRGLILRQIKRGIRADYLSLLSNKVNLRHLELQKKIAENDLEQFASQSELGRISNIDANLAEVNLNQHLINIERAQADQARILTSFQRKTGYTEALSLKRTMPMPNLAQIEAYIALEETKPSSAWTSQHGEVRRLENRIKREEEELIRIKALQRPIINFAAYATQDQRNVGAENNVDAMTYFVGLNVHWNIFDGFSTSASKRESLLRARRYEVSLNNYKKEITAQAEQVLQQIAFQTKLVRLEAQRADLHAARYSSKHSESKSGRVSTKELHAHELNKSGADLNLIRTQSVLLLMLNDYLDLVTPTKS